MLGCTLGLLRTWLHRTQRATPKRHLFCALSHPAGQNQSALGPWEGRAARVCQLAAIAHTTGWGLTWQTRVFLTVLEAGSSRSVCQHGGSCEDCLPGLQTVPPCCVHMWLGGWTPTLCCQSIMGPTSHLVTQRPLPSTRWRGGRTLTCSEPLPAACVPVLL